MGIHLLTPKLFWMGVALLYALGAIAAAVKCLNEGWGLQNVSQLWLMAGSAISNLLFALMFNR